MAMDAPPDAGLVKEGLLARKALTHSGQSVKGQLLHQAEIR
jgi:hypothetical protein